MDRITNKHFDFIAANLPIHHDLGYRSELTAEIAAARKSVPLFHVVP